MKIGFDAKRAVQNFTGLGNYSRFVINNLAQLYPENEYILFSEKAIDPNKSEITNRANIRFSLKENSSLFWRSFGIKANICKEKPQIYHGLSNELPYHINRLKVKSIVTIHDLIFRIHPECYPPIDRKIYDLKARYACRVADKIIAVSECTKSDIVSHYGVDPSRIEVVYQGCSPIFSEQQSEEKKQEVTRKYNLPKHFVLSIGSIEDRKNILLIAKALKEVPDIHFVAIGKQRKYAEKVIKYAKENGLENRIHLMSGIPLADLPAILQQAELFVYPSLYEGFGIPIIEAMSSGVPVIAATGSCLEEAGGPHSIYVDPHNPQQLANEIKRLLGDDELKKNMRTEGLQYVKRFSDKACTDALMNVYKTL